MKHPKLHLTPTWFQYETKFSPPTDLRFPAEACGSQLLTRDSGHLRGELIDGQIGCLQNLSFSPDLHEMNYGKLYQVMIDLP